MVLRTPKDCEMEGFVERIPNPRDQRKECDRFIREAERSLRASEKNFKIGEYKYCFIAGYDAMEWIAKGLLALRGIKVKQHKCVFIFLRSLFDRKTVKTRDIKAIKSAHKESMQAHYLVGKKVLKRNTRKYLDETVKPFVKKFKDKIEKM